jgi:hypothetical protein
MLQVLGFCFIAFRFDGLLGSVVERRDERKGRGVE